VSPILVRKRKLLALICAFMGGVAMLFDLVADLPVAATAAAPHTHAGEQSGGVLEPHRHPSEDGDMSPFFVGAVLGLAFGLMELFALEAWGRRLGSLAFGPLVAVKAALYTLVVFVASHAMGLIAGLLQGKTLDDLGVPYLRR
jgi:hypothetical protein